MIGVAIAGASWLDGWLRDHLGRPYNAVLGVGLVLGIIASIDSLSHAVQTESNVLKILATALFEVVLLINQLAQLHQRRQERRARREQRRTRQP